MTSVRPDRGVVRVGVSACLLGHRVRYDGGHKLDPFVADRLAAFVELVEVCPEVGVGLGTPRETLRLVAIGRRTHLVGNESGADLTDAMERWADDTARSLRAMALSGYVLKQGSPSCGIERVPLHRRSGGTLARDGRGLFAAALVRAMPLLPIEEEGRLRDRRARAGFLERVFGYRRLQRLFAGRWDTRKLAEFHERATLQLRAHDPAAARSMDDLVARAATMENAALRVRYARLYCEALARPPTARRQAAALRRAVRELARHVEAGARRQLAEAVDGLARGRTSLIVPLTLLRDHARRHSVRWLAGQTYLEPFPLELMRSRDP